MSPRRRTALILTIAVLGIAVAAAVTWATSQLVSQHIGLSSEPVTAGLRLAPSTTPRSATPGTREVRSSTSTVTPSPEPTPPRGEPGGGSQTQPPAESQGRGEVEHGDSSGRADD